MLRKSGVCRNFQVKCTGKDKISKSRSGALRCGIDTSIKPPLARGTACRPFILAALVTQHPAVQHFNCIRSLRASAKNPDQNCQRRITDRDGGVAVRIGTNSPREAVELRITESSIQTPCGSSTGRCRPTHLKTGIIGCRIARRRNQSSSSSIV